jgi:hypothetical protein
VSVPNQYNAGIPLEDGEDLGRRVLRNGHDPWCTLQVPRALGQAERCFAGPVLVVRDA